MCAVGDPRRPAWKWSEKPGEVPAFRQALLTHDDERYADELWWRARAARAGDGAGQLGLGRARAMPRSARSTRPGVLEAVDVAGLHRRDHRGPAGRLARDRRAAARLPQRASCCGSAPKRAHEILREVDPVRDRALAAIDAFLDEHAPAQ